MIKIRNLTAITTIFLMLAFIGCGGGGSSSSDDSNPTPDQIYSAVGVWNLEANLTGNPCSGNEIQLNGLATIQETSDAFTATLSESGIILKGTRDGNILSFDTIIIGGMEIKDMASGSFTLTSEDEFGGSVTIIFDSQCTEIYSLKGLKQ
jgi:hypothetical protein